MKEEKEMQGKEREGLFASFFFPCEPIDADGLWLSEALKMKLSCSVTWDYQ